MKTLTIIICFCAAVIQATAKPNVVLFFTDDQGTLDVNSYGSTDLYTPTMDKLAASGVRFTQAYAHTVCCPARAMLLTGRHPQRGKVNQWTQGNAKSEVKGLNMMRQEITLAEVLRDAGYQTGMFGKWHLGAHFDHGPTEQGFDEFFGLRGGFIDNYNHHFLHGSGFHDLYEGKQEVFFDGEYFPDLMTERAIKFIDKNKDRPFFLYVAFNIPHYPEQADKKFDERYKNMKMPRRSYAKMISTTDDRMGMILEQLEHHGLSENTIVVFMSDNGHSVEDIQIKREKNAAGMAVGTNYGANGGGGNTGKWLGHKNTFLEGGLRVPAVISYPTKLPQGVVRDQAITAMDWMPTILELCDVPPPMVKLDGSSLLAVIKSPTAQSSYKVLHWEWRNNWAVREGVWKLLGSKDKVSALHNLNDSQPEKKDYLKENPEMVAHLLALHNAWAKDVQPDHEKK
jgi:arylsulfatase A